MHWGWDSGQDTAMQPITAKINDLNPGLVIVTGDIADDSTEAEYNQYASFISGITAPVYDIPGNHDEGVGLDPTGQTVDGPADYTYYDAIVGDRHFTVDIGNIKLIGVTSRAIRAPDSPTNTGAIDASEITWLTIQLQNLGGKVPVICSHYPISNIDNAHGGTDARNLCTTYNVRAWLGGHIHQWNSLTSSGLRTIINGSVNYNRPEPLDLDGSMTICDVYENQINFTNIRARSPWDTLETTTLWTH